MIGGYKRLKPLTWKTDLTYEGIETPDNPGAQMRIPPWKTDLTYEGIET